MSLHLFGTVLTTRAVAANNRGENEGSATTLQKVIRDGDLYSTVSAEAIRYALREVWLEDGDSELNRVVSHQGSEWRDKEFGKGWDKYIDNDVLGFMHAGKETVSRRGILEISRAMSTSPWPGTLSANFASPGANPGVTHKDPIPYQAEMHDTRYQYSFAMTPEALAGKDKLKRTEKTLRAIQNLRRVGGNHGRFLYDFSPEVVVLRVTDDPAPRIMLCFDEDERGHLSVAKLVARMQGEEKDIDPDELVVGTVLPEIVGLNELRGLKVDVKPGVKTAVSATLQKVARRIG